MIEKSLTNERRKQLYDGINNWHQNELNLLMIEDVIVMCPNTKCPIIRYDNGEAYCRECNWTD